MVDDNLSSQAVLSNFTTYATEFRTRADNFIKQVLLISGGIQAVTIGAFLNGKGFVPPANSVPLLKCGWLFLSGSIVLCLTFLFFQTIAQWHVLQKQVKKLKTQTPGLEIVNIWRSFRVLIWFVGVLAFLCCVIGVAMISWAAASLIGNTPSA